MVGSFQEYMKMVSRAQEYELSRLVDEGFLKLEEQQLTSPEMENPAEALERKTQLRKFMLREVKPFIMVIYDELLLGSATLTMDQLLPRFLASHVHPPYHSDQDTMTLSWSQPALQGFNQPNTYFELEVVISQKDQGLILSVITPQRHPEHFQPILINDGDKAWEAEFAKQLTIALEEGFCEIIAQGDGF
jgi:hypothetical protein